MGYDLHITRRQDWSQTGNDISAEEWLAYINTDADLSLSDPGSPCLARWSGKPQSPDPWLEWHEGSIYAKNPDAALLNKMISIAQALGARVQGDDGEIYHSAKEPPVFPKPSFLSRLQIWMRSLRSTPHIREIAPPFQVGDRVVDAFHKETTVVEIDPKSNHGLGKVKVRYDDGREVTFSLGASGLSPWSKQKADSE